MNWVNYSGSGFNTTSTSGSFGYTMAPISQDPYLQGRGPAEASTCTALSVVPGYVFDVNGYYRDLGAPTDATRAQLRLAYFERGGPDSERLTYCLKQLLNPVVRAEYDRCTLGEVYMDRYVEDMLKRKAQREAARRMAERRAAGLVTNEETEKEALRGAFADMGINIDFGDDTPEPTSPDVLDEAPAVDQDSSRPAKQVPFSFSYYLWRTRLRSQGDLEALMEWQALLIAAFSQRGVQTKISVGLHGGMASRWALARVGYREVFFLHHLETPTTELALRAVDEWIATHHPSRREIQAS